MTAAAVVAGTTYEKFGHAVWYLVAMSPLQQVAAHAGTLVMWQVQLEVRVHAASLMTCPSTLPKDPMVQWTARLQLALVHHIQKLVSMDVKETSQAHCSHS